MEVDGEGMLTGECRATKRLTIVDKVGGEWPEHWGYYTHEFKGHGVDAGPEARVGKDILDNKCIILPERGRDGLQ